MRFGSTVSCFGWELVLEVLKIKSPRDTTLTSLFQLLKIETQNFFSFSDRHSLPELRLLLLPVVLPLNLVIKSPIYKENYP